MQIGLPSAFLRALHNHPKIRLPHGARVSQDYMLPELVADSACPKSFVREFLGSLFGGDGEAPQPSAGKKGWCSITFMMSKVAGSGLL